MTNVDVEAAILAEVDRPVSGPFGVRMRPTIFGLEDAVERAARAAGLPFDPDAVRRAVARLKRRGAIKNYRGAWGRP